MSKLKYAVAMAVAGGAAGAASQAGAAVTIQTFDYAAPTDGTSFSYDVTLAGALAPQFVFFGGEELVGGVVPSVKHHLASTGTARLSTVAFSTAGLPDSSEVFGATDVKTYSGPPGGFTPLADPADSYYHLTFDANGTQYLGTAQIKGDHSLGSISYDVASTSAAPEPAAWALMIAGVGLSGAALRRRRQLAA